MSRRTSGAAVLLRIVFCFPVSLIALNWKICRAMMYKMPGGRKKNIRKKKEIFSRALIGLALAQLAGLAHQLQLCYCWTLSSSFVRMSKYPFVVWLSLQAKIQRKTFSKATFWHVWQGKPQLTNNIDVGSVSCKCDCVTELAQYQGPGIPNIAIVNSCCTYLTSQNVCCSCKILKTDGIICNCHLSQCLIYIRSVFLQFESNKARAELIIWWLRPLISILLYFCYLLVPILLGHPHCILATQDDRDWFKEIQTSHIFTCFIPS